jgi:hypothetical protein
MPAEVRLFAVSVTAAVACRAPPSAPPRPALAPELAAWIPADVVMVIGAGGDTSAIDEVAAALGVPAPGRFVALPEDLATAWQRTGGARGALWMQLDRDAASTARCAVIADPRAAVQALIAAGGVTSRAGAASLIELGAGVTVLRGGVACTVTSGAPSRRARHAVRLATLTGPDRLSARADAAAALGALPPATVIAWGDGALIGAGLDAEGVELAGRLGRFGDVAIAVDVAAGTRTVDITVVGAGGEPGGDPAPGAEHRFAVGRLAAAPPAPPLTPAPAAPVDENTDVPASAELIAARDRFDAAIADASELAARIAAADDAARARWRAAWGPASVVEAGARADVRWPLPAVIPPPLDDASAPLRARRDRRVAEAEAMIAELLRIRARDVSAHDRIRR